MAPQPITTSKLIWALNHALGCRAKVRTQCRQCNHIRSVLLYDLEGQRIREEARALRKALSGANVIPFPPAPR